MGGRRKREGGDLGPGAVLGLLFFGVFAFVVTRGDAFVGEATVGTLLFGGLVGLGAMLARRRRERRDAELDAQVAAASVVSSVPCSTVVFTLAFPSAARADVAARIAAAGSPYRTLTDVLELFVTQDDVRLRGRLEVSAPAASPRDETAGVAHALDALSRRDTAGDARGYRAGVPTRSSESAGTVVLAIALAVREPAPAPAVADRGAMRSAVDAVLPIQAKQVVHTSVRWIPSAESHAFDEPAMSELFGELTEL